MQNYRNIQNGWTVYGSDGKKIGTIKECFDSYCHMDTGFLGLGPDYWVPFDAFQEVRDGEVVLNVASDRLRDMGWDHEPTGDLAGAGSGTSDMSNRDRWTGTMPRTDAEYGESSGTFSGTAGEYTTSRGSDLTGDYNRTGEYDQNRSMPLREEELQANRTRENAGEVSIGKDIVEERRTMDVPVTHEEVQIHERPVDRPASSPISDSDTIRVPVTEERVDVEKQAHVYGEVDVEKRQVTDQQQVSDTVRKEVPRVNKTGDLKDRVEGDVESDLDPNDPRNRDRFPNR